MVVMERRNSNTVKASKPKLVPILKKRSSFAHNNTDSSPPKGVQLNTRSVSVQEIITEESFVPVGSPTFERVMRDLSDNLKNSLSTESSLTSIPDACEKEGQTNVRVIRRSVSCASGKKKKVRFPARQMSQSFTASSGLTSKTKVQRHSSFIPLKKNGSSNSFKFISSNESYSHEEGEFKTTTIDKKASIFDLPDTKYLQRKLSYVSSTLS